MSRQVTRTAKALVFVALCLAMATAVVSAQAVAAPPQPFLDQVIALTNQARADNGLPPLTANPLLTAAAQQHAEAMAADAFFDHINPKTGAQPSDRVTAEGYRWSVVAENIAAGDATPADVMAGWLNSPGHRANILDKDVREIGVGYVFKPNDTFPGPTGYGHYWVQVFAASQDGTVAAPGTGAPGLASPAAAAAWQALCPESVDSRGHPTWNGNPVILKGTLRGGPGGSFAYSWDPGDRSSAQAGSVTDPYNISIQHVYPDARAKTVFTARLTVTDTATTQTTACAYPIVVYDKSQAAQSEAAIDDGLWYLHTQMARANEGGVASGDWEGGDWDVGVTAKALLALEIQGHRADGDAARDPYVETVQRGLNYLFSGMRQQPLTAQPAGDPDSNGNGFGLYVFADAGEAMYEDGIATMAVAASVKDPSRQVAQVGGEGVKSRTFAEIGQDMADFLVWAQVDSPNEFHRGGWRYYPESSDADMSVTQWPVLALDALEANWGLAAPAWAKAELREHFLANIQDESGGFGYATRGENNNARTAAGIISLLWTGVSPDDPRIVAAQTYIGDHWDQDNLGNFYTMYAVMKASRLIDPPVTLYGSHDWYDEYQAFLLQNRAADGHWSDSHWGGNATLSTAWGVLILSRGVFSYVAPQPGSLDLTCPPASLVLRPDKAVSVISKLKGVDLPTCQGVPTTAADVVLVLDNSAAAGSGAGSAWEQSTAYAAELVDALGVPIRLQREVTATSRFALITASPVPELAQPLATDADQTKAALSSVKTGGVADLAGGVNLAAQLLATTPPDRNRAIVLMAHDKSALTPKLVAAAQAISPTIPVYLVSTAIGVKPAALITDAQARAVAPGWALQDPTPDDLRQLWLAITGGDAQAAGRWILVEDTWSPPGTLEFSEVKGPGARLAQDGVAWEPPTLAITDVVPISYKVKAPAISTGAAFTLTRDIAYVDCNGFPEQRQVCRKAFTSAALPTPIPPVTVTASPMTITLTACPGAAPQGQDLAFTLPPSPVKADVLFVFDVTRSMQDVLDSAAQNADRIMSDLTGLVPDIQFGVVSVSDYPVAPYGLASDQAFSLTLPMTDDPNEVRAALGGLTLLDGGDGAEAYGLAFHKAASDPAIGWRKDARHLIVSFGDSVPHDDNINKGIASPEPILPGQKWSTAYAQADVAGTDNLDWQTVLADLRNSPEQITVLHVVSGSTDRQNAPPQALLAYWKYWAGLTGGDAVLQENAGQLPDTIRTLVAQSGRHIDALRLRTTGGYATWVKITPAQQSNLLVPDTGLPLSFQAAIAIPKDMTGKIPAGDYTIKIDAVGDGTVYNTWTLIVTVPTSCAVPLPPPPCALWPWNVLLWLIPLILVLLGLLLWWLLQRLRFGDEWQKRRKENGWRCWLPCLLGLLLLLLLLFLLGLRGREQVCYSLEGRTMAQATVPANFRIVTPTPGAMPLTQGATPTPTPGQSSLVNPSGPTPAATPVPGSGSRRVALVGPMPDPGLPEVAVTTLTVDQLNLDTLRDFDTLVLAQQCDAGQWLPTIQEAIRTFVAAGGKLVIYDSDECSQTVDYRWLPAPFSTNNPGARGSSNGRFIILENNTMMNGVDEAEMSAGEIGDANVMVTKRLAWCGDAQARNVNGKVGYVHGYSFWGKGLILYNGLDTDSIGMSSMDLLWQNEINQPWEGITGQRPAELVCRRRIGGPFYPFDVLGLSIPFWLPWLFLLPLWLLCFLGCRKKKKVKPNGGNGPKKLHERAYLPPPEPRGAWAGPPPVWDPERTLIIGLGGAGRHVLTLIKKNLLDAGAGKITDKVRLLLIDNSQEEQVGKETADVSFAGVHLAKGEILALGQNFNELIRGLADDLASRPEIARWFPVSYYAEGREVELDVRRGTGGQRPLGRLTAFADLNQTEASRLWRALLDAVGIAKEGEQARIMVVGSLAGGFGSAVVADVAYLARLAARDSGAALATIEGYLAAQHTFDSVASLSLRRELEANVFAALRELRRFQLVGHSFPYRMNYSLRRRDDKVWDGQLDRPLMDDLYLFDAFRPQRPLLRDKPLNGVFATMADAITLHLDQASRSGSESLWAYRRTVQGQSTEEQRLTGQAVVSSLGTFVYRLPVYDLVEALKVRWAKHLLGLFMLGDAGGELRLAPDLNTEDVDISPATCARQFIQGQAKLGGTPPPAVPLLGQWLEVSGPGPAAWVSDANSLTLGATEAEAQRYKVYLVDALVGLLNGYTEDPMIARTGKPGYAVRWLEEVERLWGDVVTPLQMLPGRLGAKVSFDATKWQGLITEYRSATAAVREQLLQTCADISRKLGASAGGWRDANVAAEAVYDRLLAREQQLVDYRQQMTEVVTRRYFLDDKLLDTWYGHYLAGQVRGDIGRLYWQPTPDGNGVDLALNGLGGSTRLRADGAERMADALLALAGYYCQPIWSQETLAMYLEGADLKQENIPQTAGEMWAVSAPLMAYDTGGAPNVQELAVLGVNETVRDTQALSREFVHKLPGGKKMMRQLAITDRYSMLLARLADVVPADATTLHRDAEQTYRLIYGLTPNTAGQAAGAPPRAVFAAERHALAYEQRLPELNQAPRLFHPLFVTALEDEAKAILFVKALAAGLLKTQYSGDAEFLAVDTPGGPYALTSDEDRRYKKVSLLLMAMLRFVSAPDRILRGVADQVAQAPDAPALWREFRKNELPRLLRSDRPEEQDLGAFADLVLYDLISGRIS